MFHVRAEVVSVWLRGAAAALLGASAALLASRFTALDWVAQTVAPLVGDDGFLSPESRALLAALLLGAGVLAALIAAFVVVFATERGRRALVNLAAWDPLQRAGFRVPNPYLVLVASIALGLAFLVLWLASTHLGGWPRALFVKEGPLENLTFALDAAAAVLCVAAARLFRHGSDAGLRRVRLLYAACGVLLLLVAMEEINWGQTFLRFQTPGGWAAINHQGEISLHNLLDRSELTAAWQAIAVAFATGCVLLTAASAYAPGTLVAAIAPPPSLLPLALIASYSGARLHPELIELLLAVFFAFYGYRIFVAARSSVAAAGSGCTPSAASAGRGGVTRFANWRTAVRIAVPVVLVGVLLSPFDWVRASHALGRVHLWGLLGLFALMIVELMVSTLKWSYALRMHDLRFRFRYLLQALCTGFFMNSFLPTAVGGDVYRVYKTLPGDGFRSRALSAVIIERAVGLLSLLALGGIGALLITDEYRVARLYCLAMLGATVAGVFVILALERGWLHAILRRGERLAAVAAVDHSVGLLRNRRREWTALIATSVVYQSMSIGIMFGLFALLDSNASLAATALIAALVGLAAVLPVSINGIGVMEGALVAGAVMLGIDYDEAVLVAFLRRMLNLLLAACCGLVHSRLTSPALPDEVGGLLARVAALGKRLVPAPRPALGNDRTLALNNAGAAGVPLASGVHVTEVDRTHTQLLEFTYDAIIIWEMDGGGIRYFNRAAEQLYGYRRDEVYGRVTHELLKTELAGGPGELEKKLARYGVWIGELRHTTRDGRRLEVEGRLALLSQHNGHWLVLEVNRDISDRKAAEAARLAMARQLAELRSRTSF